MHDRHNGTDFVTINTTLLPTWPWQAANNPRATQEPILQLGRGALTSHKVAHY